MPISKNNFQRRKNCGEKIWHWAYLKSKKKRSEPLFKWDLTF
jgi:hypothetical protein